MFVWCLRIVTIWLCYTQFELNESKQKYAEIFDYKSFSNGLSQCEQLYYFLIIQHQIKKSSFVIFHAKQIFPKTIISWRNAFYFVESLNVSFIRKIDEEIGLLHDRDNYTTYSTQNEALINYRLIAILDLRIIQFPGH